MKKTVLVTGAAGYIGRHVVKALLDDGYKVLANDFNCKGIDERADMVEADIFSGNEKIYETLGCPDVLIHMAWRDGFIHNSPLHMLNLSSHFEFLRNMALGGCSHIAVMGSMHEVGYWEGAIDADTPCAPLSQYGVAKNALREAMLLLSKENGFSLYWLRAYYIYGDDIRGSSIFSKITQAARDGKTEFPFTSGKNKYDFISVEELGQQIAAASTQDEYSGVINVCSGEAKTLAEQVEWFIRDRKLPISLQYGAFPDRPYDSPGEWGDATIIKDIMRKKDR